MSDTAFKIDEKAWWENAHQCFVVFREDARQLERELEQTRAELRVVKLKADASLANNLCPDHRDKQKGKSCLACAIESAESKNTELTAQVAACIEALIHLTELKRYKDKEGKTVEYLKQQPVAWENANKVISNLPAEAEKMVRSKDNE